MAASRASYAADGTLICPTCMMAEQSRHAAKTIRTKSRSELAGVVLLVVVLLGVSCFCGLSIWISQMLR